jgi:hypothetical protein
MPSNAIQFQVGKELFRELMFTSVNQEMAEALEAKEAEELKKEVGDYPLQQLEEKFANESLQDHAREAVGKVANAVDDAVSFFIQRDQMPLYARPIMPCLAPIVHSKWFDHTMIGLIALNTIIMCCDRYPQTGTEEAVWKVFNHFFNAAFSLEMLVKIMALGVTQYTKDSFNCLDAVLVVCTWTEFFVLEVGQGTDGTGAFMALRTLRLLRIFKVSRTWTYHTAAPACTTHTAAPCTTHTAAPCTSPLQVLWNMPGLQCESYMVVRMVNQTSAFALLFVVFLVVMGLIGRQQLAHRMRFSIADGYPVGLGADESIPYEVPRLNFDSLGNSMIAVFQLVTGERWERIMFDANRAVGSNNDIGQHDTNRTDASGGVSICVVSVIIGQFIVLNIFVAMLINSQQTLEGSMKSADMVLDKVEITVFHKGGSVKISVSRGKLEQIGQRGEPAVWLVLAELVDLASANSNGLPEEGGDVNSAFGLTRDDLSPERAAMFKVYMQFLCFAHAVITRATYTPQTPSISQLFLLPDLSREVVPRQLKDVGIHFGRGERVIDIDEDDDGKCKRVGGQSVRGCVWLSCGW